MDLDLKQLLDPTNLQGWEGLGLAAIVGLVASMIAVRLLRRLLGHRWFAGRPAGLMLLRALPSLQITVPAAMLVMLVGGAPDKLPHIAFARQIVLVALILSLTYNAARAIAAAGEWFRRRHPVNVADNLMARRMLTQTHVLVRTANTLVVLIGGSIALMTFPPARHFGMSLLASAGVAGLVVGLAAKSVLGNLLAGLQIALTQPMRIDDVLIVEGEWGRVEEITATYVVIKIWDERRLVVPLQWFIENPFQNWTRTSAQIIGSVFLWVDYRTPLEPLRAALKRIVEAAPEWDRRVCVLQATDASQQAMQLRILLSAADSGRSWDLQCKVREGLLRFLQGDYPDCLPRLRAEVQEPTPRRAEPRRETTATVK